MYAHRRRLQRIERALTPAPVSAHDDVADELRLVAIDQRALNPGESFEAAAARLHPTTPHELLVRVVRIAAPMPEQQGDAAEADAIATEPAAVDQVPAETKAAAQDESLKEPPTSPRVTRRGERVVSWEEAWAKTWRNMQG